MFCSATRGGGWKLPVKTSATMRAYSEGNKWRNYYERIGRYDVLCATCGFQRSNRVSTPGLGNVSTRWYLPLSVTSCATCRCLLSVAWELPAQLLRYITSSKPDNSVLTPMTVVLRLFIIISKKVFT